MIRALTYEEMQLVAEKLSYVPTNSVRSVALADEKAVYAAVLYDHWTYNSVNVHVYSQGPAHLFNKEFVREIFKYPFEDSGRGVLLAVTPGDAKESLAVSRVLGFKEVYRIRDGWKVGIDMVIKEMRKDQCRYLAKAA